MNKNLLQFKLYSCIGLILILSVIPLNVFANSDFYSGNDILFYDSSDTCTTSVSSSSLSGASLPTETIAYLDGQVKSQLEQNMARYNYASQATGVPWQAIAALHYREANLDPTKSISNGQPLASGESYTNSDGLEIVSDPNEDAKNAALHFIDMAKSVYGVDPSSSTIVSSGSVQDWGNAFLAYNRGNIYKWAGAGFEKSPYVMNGYDSQYMNMDWPAVSGEPLSGKDSNMGALTVMAYLGGVTLGSNCSSSGGSVVQGNVLATALALAVNYETDSNQPADATEAYRQAIVTYNNSAAVYPEITDCGRFVSTVMRSSGVDPSFPEVSVITLRNHMASLPDKYQAIGNADMSQLQPGDIITVTENGNSHIMIFTGNNNGYQTAEASLYKHVPSVRKIGNLNWMFNQPHEIWRVSA